MRDCDLSEAAAARVASVIYSHDALHSGTDGGLTDGLGTFGFVWSDSNKMRLLAIGKGRIPGNPYSTCWT